MPKKVKLAGKRAVRKQLNTVVDPRLFARVDKARRALAMSRAEFVRHVLTEYTA